VQFHVLLSRWTGPPPASTFCNKYSFFNNNNNNNKAHCHLMFLVYTLKNKKVTTQDRTRALWLQTCRVTGDDHHSQGKLPQTGHAVDFTTHTHTHQHTSSAAGDTLQNSEHALALPFSFFFSFLPLIIFHFLLFLGLFYLFSFLPPPPPPQFPAPATA
jgi:hypothetical protein